MKYRNDRGEESDVPIFRYVCFTLLGFLLIVGTFLAISGAVKVYSRYQKRQDAKNSVQVTKTLIQREAQQVAVQKQTAEVKVAEAVGIRRSQEIINATLTPLYLQHEAIQAQMAMANSPNHTQIYIPSGSNGIPLINDVGPGAQASK